jgi:hypothetical protein
LLAEFTTYKQQWQQRKGTSYESGEGKQIVPGFTGQYFK